jgi:hypothetical protein
MLLPKLVSKCRKLGVLPSDLMQKKNSTKSGTLPHLALVSGIMAVQNKHYVRMLGLT